MPFIPYPTLLHDASGTLVGAVNMLMDVSDRHDGERHLRESETRYRAIFDNARVAIWGQDFSEIAAWLAS